MKKIKAFIVWLNIRALRRLITLGYLDNTRVKRILKSLNVHPTILERPNYIFADVKSTFKVSNNLPASPKGRVAIYTCLTNGYDDLSSPLTPDINADFIVFTDNPDLKVPGWETRLLPNPLNLDPRRLSRMPKVLPHRYLQGYDYSIYVDANLTIMGDLVKLVQYLDHGYSMALCVHPDNRDCLYQEAETIIHFGYDKQETIENQMETYKLQGMPAHFGLYECSALIRSHNDHLLMETMEIWWQEIKTKSHRDQLSFTYSLWKTGLKVNAINTQARQNDLLLKKAHHSQ